jgi:hypothetical protein
MEEKERRFCLLVNNKISSPFPNIFVLVVGELPTPPTPWIFRRICEQKDSNGIKRLKKQCIQIYLQ